jgi:hypothetical protein
MPISIAQITQDNGRVYRECGGHSELWCANATEVIYLLSSFSGHIGSIDYGFEIGGTRIQTAPRELRPKKVSSGVTRQQKRAAFAPPSLLRSGGHSSVHDLIQKPLGGFRDHALRSARDACRAGLPAADRQRARGIRNRVSRRKSCRRRRRNRAGPDRRSANGISRCPAPARCSAARSG